MFTNYDALEIMQINPNFKKSILRSLPGGLTRLEQGLFIYFKLCSVLNYDAGFFAAEQEGVDQQKQAYIEYIKRIGVDTNEVVCYNFNLICLDLLKEIGINAEFVRDGNFDYGEKMYGTHNDISMFIPPMPKEDIPQGLKIGEEIVLYGHVDMTNIKTGDRLNVVLRDTRREEDPEIRSQVLNDFHELSDKIANIVRKQDKLAQKQQNEEKLNEQKVQALENEFYDYSYQEIGFFSDNEKIDIFLEQVGKIDLGDVASIKYARKLYKSVSKSLDNADNYNFTIIKEKRNNGTYGMVGILSFVGKNSNFYIKITPPNKINEIKHNTLQEGFDKGIYDYIGGYYSVSSIIPDIKSNYVEEHSDVDTARQQIKYHKRTGKWLTGHQWEVSPKLIAYCQHTESMSNKTFNNGKSITPISQLSHERER